MEFGDMKPLLRELNLFLSRVSGKLGGDDKKDCIQLLTKVLQCYKQFDYFVKQIHFLSNQHKAPVFHQAPQQLPTDYDEDDTEYGDVEAPLPTTGVTSGADDQEVYEELPDSPALLPDDTEYGDVEAPLPTTGVTSGADDQEVYEELPDSPALLPDEDDTEYGDVEAPLQTTGVTSAELPPQDPANDEYLPPLMTLTPADDGNGTGEYEAPLSRNQPDNDSLYEDPCQTVDPVRCEKSKSLNSVNEDDEIYTRGLVTLPKIKPADLTGYKCAGLLHKKSPNLLGLFQERYCILKDHLFYYFENKKSKRQNGVIDCREHILDSCLSANKKFSFQLRSAIRTFKFRASDKANYDMWIRALSTHSLAPPVTQATEPTGAKSMPPFVNPCSSENDDDDDIYEDTADTVGSVSHPDETEEEYADTADTAEQFNEVLYPSQTPVATVDDDEMYTDTAVTDDDIYECVDELIGVKKPPAEPRPLPQLPPLPSDVESAAQTDAQNITPPAADLPGTPVVPSDSAQHGNQPSDKKCLEHLVYPIPELAHDNYTNFYVAMWDYVAGEGDELTFHRGDTVYVVRRQYEEWGWWEAQLGTTVGFAPKSYLMEAFEAPS